MSHIDLRKKFQNGTFHQFQLIYVHRDDIGTQKRDLIKKLNFRNLNLIQTTKELTMYFSHLTKICLSIIGLSSHHLVKKAQAIQGLSIIHTMRVKVK
jgi:DNA transposition AAA+ family ATPase